MNILVTDDTPVSDEKNEIFSNYYKLPSLVNLEEKGHIEVSQ